MSLIGYRWWTTQRVRDKLYLCSLYLHALWPHDRPIRAVCCGRNGRKALYAPTPQLLTDAGVHPRLDSGHQPVRRDCECGIYAWLKPGIPSGFLNAVAGRVQLFGWTMRMARPTKYAPQEPDLACASRARVLSLYDVRSSVMPGPGTVWPDSKRRALLAELSDAYQVPVMEGQAWAVKAANR